MSLRRLPRSSRIGIAPNDLILYIILANALLFAAWFWEPAGPTILLRWMALWPLDGSAVGFRPWQLLTYGFVHSPQVIAHIGFNMFAVWIFGRPLAQEFGTDRFVLYYFGCMAGAGVAQLLVSSLTGAVAPTIGASGSVFGLLVGFGLLYPNRTITLLFPPIPIRAKYFVLIYGALELVLGFSLPNSSVAHFAHLGGMLTGFLLLRYWRR